MFGDDTNDEYTLRGHFLSSDPHNFRLISGHCSFLLDLERSTVPEFLAVPLTNIVAAQTLARVGASEFTSSSLPPRRWAMLRSINHLLGVSDYGIIIRVANHDYSGSFGKFAHRDADLPCYSSAMPIDQISTSQIRLWLKWIAHTTRLLADHIFAGCRKRDTDTLNRIADLEKDLSSVTLFLWESPEVNMKRLIAFANALEELD